MANNKVGGKLGQNDLMTCKAQWCLPTRVPLGDFEFFTSLKAPTNIRHICQPRGRLQSPDQLLAEPRE